MSRVIIFPAGKEAEATAYMDGCNAHYQANIEPGTDYAYIRNDAFGQWVVPYYGDEVNGAPFAEPPECLALRSDGVLHDFAIWPPEEE